MLKQITGGFITAFSMYSVIPMPQREWTRDTMKYAMCFFPFVGLLIGGAVYGWTLLSLSFQFSPLLFSAVLALLPVLISGAIHLDGFLDTSDALCSRQEKQRKLEILKDPHIGAFGVISCVGYFVLTLGLASEYYRHVGGLLLLCLGYIVSRVFSSLAVVSFPTAKTSGLAYLFSDQAQKIVVRVVNLCTLSLCYLAMLLLYWQVALLLIGIHCLSFCLFRIFAYRQFGGMTGDLAGFLVCILELLNLLGVTFGVLL